MTSSLDANTLFRQCAEPDLPAVQLMVDELYAAEPNTPNLRPNVGLTFRELANKPEKGRLIVFEKNDRIIGYCIIIFFWSNEYSGNIIEIDEMYVSEPWRASGVATELLQWLEQKFVDDLSGFSLQVARRNQPALRFAEKSGFSVSRNQHMIKVLSANN